MNLAVLMGRLCKENELKLSGSGLSILKNTIAVDRKGKDKGTDFIRIVAFGKSAEFLDKYTGKGNRITVEGNIRADSYENKDGGKVYTTELVVNSAYPIDWKDRDGGIPEGFKKVEAEEDESLPF